MSIFPESLVSIISKAAPVLGTALGGPAGGLVGSLISSVLGVDMNKPDEVINKIQSDPIFIGKLKELDMQLNDLQNARSFAETDTGILRYQRIFLAIMAMLSIFADIILIEYTSNAVVSQILIIMLVFLVWDIRQIYKFFFGSGEEVPSFLLKSRR